MILFGLSMMAFCFHLIRMYFDSPVDFSLDWNLFLSWIPLLIAFFTKTLIRKHGSIPITLFVLSVCWIAFFPNAPYMVTDLAHLTVDYHRDLTWHDIIMLFLYAEVSLFNGLVSLYWMHQAWLSAYPKRLGLALLLVSFPLGGFGVYLGRVSRMNTWDIIQAPEKILGSLVNGIVDRTALLMSFEIGFLLAGLYLVLWMLVRFRVRKGYR
jgi:uncharacterized membrane protein